MSSFLVVDLKLTSLVDWTQVVSVPVLYFSSQLITFTYLGAQCRLKPSPILTPGHCELSVILPWDPWHKYCARRERSEEKTQFLP